MSTRKGKLATGEPPLPVTPMLDMTFQLLFFFIATYSPATRLEGQIEMALPGEQVNRPAEPNNVPPPDVPVDVPALFTIELKAEKGHIRFLTLRSEAGKTRFFIDPSQDPDVTKRDANRMWTKVREKLVEAKKTRVKKENEKDTVRVMANPNTRWDQVMKVVDLCTELDFAVSFLPPSE